MTNRLPDIALELGANLITLSCESTPPETRVVDTTAYAKAPRVLAAFLAACGGAGYRRRVWRAAALATPRISPPVTLGAVLDRLALEDMPPEPLAPVDVEVVDDGNGRWCKVCSLSRALCAHNAKCRLRLVPAVVGALGADDELVVVL